MTESENEDKSKAIYKQPGFYIAIVVGIILYKVITAYLSN